MHTCTHSPPSTHTHACTHACMHMHSLHGNRPGALHRGRLHPRQSHPGPDHGTFCSVHCVLTDIDATRFGALTARVPVFLRFDRSPHATNHTRPPLTFIHTLSLTSSYTLTHIKNTRPLCTFIQTTTSSWHHTYSFTFTQTDGLPRRLSPVRLRAAQRLPNACPQSE